MTDAPGLLATVRAEIAALDVSRRALRSFGLVVGAVFLGISALIAWKHDWTVVGAVPWFGGLGATLMVFGAVLPTLLRPLHRVWMGLAFVLGFVMTRVILTVAFFAMFAPVGLFFRLIRRDALHQKPDPEAASYWIPRDATATDRARLERLF